MALLSPQLLEAPNASAGGLPFGISTWSIGLQIHKIPLQFLQTLGLGFGDQFGFRD